MDEITFQKRRLQKLVADGHVRRATLAKQAGFMPNTLHFMMEVDWDPSSRVLAALVRAANELGYPRNPRKRGSDDGLAA
jgi:lambda repressor-like predicted transcriptional regulator